MPPKKSKQILTTDTQLIKLINAAGGSQNCALHGKLLEDMQDDIEELTKQIKTLDEAIRGNGKPGLRADVTAVQTELDNHKEEAELSQLGLRWKVGIVCSLIIAFIPVFITIHSYWTAEQKQAAAAKVIVKEVIRELASSPRR